MENEKYLDDICSNIDEMNHIIRISEEFLEMYHSYNVYCNILNCIKTTGGVAPSLEMMFGENFSSVASMEAEATEQTTSAEPNMWGKIKQFFDTVINWIKNMFSSVDKLTTQIDTLTKKLQESGSGITFPITVKRPKSLTDQVNAIVNKDENFQAVREAEDFSIANKEAAVKELEFVKDSLTKLKNLESEVKEVSDEAKKNEGKDTGFFKKASSYMKSWGSKQFVLAATRSYAIRLLKQLGVTAHAEAAQPIPGVKQEEPAKTEEAKPAEAPKQEETKPAEQKQEEKKPEEAPKKEEPAKEEPKTEPAKEEPKKAEEKKPEEKKESVNVDTSTDETEDGSMSPDVMKDAANNRNAEDILKNRIGNLSGLNTQIGNNLKALNAATAETNWPDDTLLKSTKEIDVPTILTGGSKGVKYSPKTIGDLKGKMKEISDRITKFVSSAVDNFKKNTVNNKKEDVLAEVKKDASGLSDFARELISLSKTCISNCKANPNKKSLKDKIKAGAKKVDEFLKPFAPKPIKTTANGEYSFEGFSLEELVQYNKELTELIITDRYLGDEIITNDDYVAPATALKDNQFWF